MLVTECGWEALLTVERHLFTKLDKLGGDTSLLIAHFQNFLGSRVQLTQQLKSSTVISAERSCPECTNNGLPFCLWRQAASCTRIVLSPDISTGYGHLGINYTVIYLISLFQLTHSWFYLNTYVSFVLSKNVHEITGWMSLIIYVF